MDTRKLLEELENVIYDNLEIEYDYVTDLQNTCCLLYTSPSPRDRPRARMPSSA